MIDVLIIPAPPAPSPAPTSRLFYFLGRTGWSPHPDDLFEPVGSGIHLVLILALSGNFPDYLEKTQAAHNETNNRPS